MRGPSGEKTHDLRKRLAGELDEPRRHPGRRGASAGAPRPPAPTRQPSTVERGGRHRHQGVASARDRDQDAQRSTRSTRSRREDIGKLPDRNVADALQRIPGVNTESAASGEGGFDENDRVSIRGTSPSLTQVTVDGHAIATGDWFILDQYQTVGRSVSFNLLPAEMVQSTVVYKTQDASLLEGGVSGVVDLQTRAPLDDRQQPVDLSQASAEGAYNSLPATGSPRSTACSAGRTRTTPSASSCSGLLRGPQRAPLRPGDARLHRDHRRHADRRGQSQPGRRPGADADRLDAVRTGDAPARAARSPSQWRPNDRLELNLDGFYSHLDASNVNDNYMYWGTQRAQQ